MGYELWTSPITGYRRRGTRLAELRALLASGITAHAILEPLRWCPADAPSADIQSALRQKGFDVAGVLQDERGLLLARRTKGRHVPPIIAPAERKSENDAAPTREREPLRDPTKSHAAPA